MCTHLTSDESRQGQPDPAAVNQNLTPINQALLNALQRYENESLAEAWLTARRWPEGIRCPKCGCDSIARPPDRKPLPYRCRGCRTQFSVKSHSALRSSKHSLGTWVQALHICSAFSNPDAVDMRDILPVTNKAAWNLAMRIHEAWEFYEPDLRASESQRRLT